MYSKIAIAYNGCVKIVNQFRGTENIFGYRSTTANQLYLLYCITGKIYYSEKVHPFAKYSWFTVNLCGVLLSCTTGLACLLYDTTQDFRKLLDIATFISTSTGLSIILPGFVYCQRNQIENMIDEIDKLSETSPNIANEFQKRIQEKTMISYNFCAMFTIIFVYSFACIIDVVLFYEEEKVKNFKYYPFPLPNVEKNGSAGLFAVHSMLFIFGCPLYWFQWISGVNIILLWGATCHNELMYVRDRLNSAMHALDMEATQNAYKTSRSWVGSFRQTLIQNMKTFKTINRAIDNFRGIVELATSLAIPVNFLAQVINLYITIFMDMPFSVRLKSISFCLAAIWPMFLLYWVGEILENAVSEISFSIYCSPWHYSVKVRKEVQIFLCQTQRSKNLFMWKVYPLVLRNYSRLANATQSAVNILRAITSKSN